MQKIYSSYHINCFSSIFRSDNRLFRESIDPLCAALGIIHFFNFFFQAEDGIRDAQESRGLGDVYKRQKKDMLIKVL